MKNERITNHLSICDIYVSLVHVPDKHRSRYGYNQKGSKETRI